MKDLRLRRDAFVESKLRKVQKKSISEDIAQQIMDLIAGGDLMPGQMLPTERDLCLNFGASRSSLREALRCLSIVGVLDARVGEGTSVALNGEKFLGKVMEWRLITEKHEILNLMEVRLALEGLSAASAATRATQENLERLDDLLARMQATKEPKAFGLLDLEFHIELANASGNALIRDLVSMIRSQLARALSKVLLLPHALPLSYKEHRAVFEAIKVRNPTAANEAMQEHLRCAIQRYNAQNRGTYAVASARAPNKSPVRATKRGRKQAKPKP